MLVPLLPLATLANLVAAIPDLLVEARPERRERDLEATLAAASRLPTYRESWGAEAPPAELASLPILDRHGALRLADEVRARGEAGPGIEALHSSGSLGHPFEILVDRSHQASRYAERLRFLLANGWRPWHRGAWIVRLFQNTSEGRATRRGRLGGATFRSHLDDPAETTAWLERFRPRYVYAMPSHLEEIVSAAERGAVRLASLERIFTGGEVLEPELRRRAEAVFGVPVRDSYGSSEAFLAGECRAGRLHENVAHVHLELLGADGSPARPGEPARVLVTTLRNRVMPLVRYEIGDLAVLAPTPCDCGRPGRTLERVLGRAVHFFRRPDGRRISPWHALGAARRIREIDGCQLVQRDFDRYLLRYVTAAPLPSEREATLVALLRERLEGEPVIELERVERIPRLASGKVLTTVCETPEARA